MNFQIKRILICIMAAFTATAAMSQSKTVTGNITNDLGTIVSKVAVSVKGTDVSTSSDADGNFSISVPDNNSVLTFELDGYDSVESEVGEKRVVNVVMPVTDIFALAFEDLMNTMVSSSSFFNLKSKETPGYIFSLDMSGVKSSRSLIELARMAIPGMSDGSHPDTEIIGVRGMKSVDNSKTMVMFDGQSLNQRANVGYGLGLSSKLLGDVKSIEVSLGPNAIVHGSGAISGYINMVPKNGYENSGFFANVEKEYEQNAENQQAGISKAELGVGVGSEKRNLYLYAGYYFGNGWTPDSSLTTKYTEEELSQVKVGDTHKANFRLSAHANYDALSLNVGYMQNYRSSKVGAQHNFQRQMNAKLKYDLRLTDSESIDFIVSNELTDLGRLTKTPFQQSGGAESHIEGKLVAKTTRINNNSLAVGMLFGKRNFYAGKFYFGGDIDPTWGDNNYIIDPSTGKAFLDEDGNSDANKLWASGQMPNGKWQEFAVFAEDIYKLNDNLVFALGLRYDRFNVKDFDEVQDKISPRVAMSYAINDQHVVRASYQQGFRTMDFFNLAQTRYNKVNVFNFRMLNHVENPSFDISIKPETLQSIELNYQADFLDKMVSVEVNGFFNMYKETIDFLKLATWSSDSYLADNDYRGDFTDVGLKYFSKEDLEKFMYEFAGGKYKRNPGLNTYFGAYVNNGEDINVAGGEIIVNVNPTINTRVRAIYSLAKSLTDSYADESQCPTNQLKLSATQYLLDRNLMLNAQFAWEPSLTDNDKNRETYHDVYFADRTLLDFTASYSFMKYVTISATVNNVLGEKRPGITYKPNLIDNYPELTKLGSNEREYWLSLRIAL